ncbi:MAG: pantoate--beta-alanine ligase [Polyangiaceae bacterium]
MHCRTFSEPNLLRRACDDARSMGKRVGFVPTMGALHSGHLALVSEARRRAEFVVVSIFVNPMQFGPSEDYARYPRDLDADVRKLEPTGVDIVFAPDRKSMIVPGDQTRVRVSGLTEVLEGIRRPGHFDGVATVVTKLFSIVGPCVAVFGRKDYQQLVVVRRLVEDLMLPVEVIGHATLREPDGLAMSSRNRWLSSTERQSALSISRGLDAAARRFAEGERDARELAGVTTRALDAAGVMVEYVETSDPDSLAPVRGATGSRVLLSVACRVGSTRLIDNVVLGEDLPPLG